MANLGTTRTVGRDKETDPASAVVAAKRSPGRRSDYRVTIAMPAYQAAKTLAKTVAAIPAGVASQVIVVDDASTDRTAAISRGLGILTFVHDTNRGYGGNQKTCYVKSLADGADLVVLLHPDYQYDPKAVPLLIAPILSGDADMTFGSRFAGLGDPLGGGMPMYRYVGNRITTAAENLMLGSRFTEVHSGMRAYTRQCLLRLPFLSYSDDFAFDSQLMVDAVTAGVRVVEVPIPTRYTAESSSISITRSLDYVASSLGYCARRSVQRGRRGRRWGVAAPVEPKTRQRSESADGRRCVLCGELGMQLVLASNATGLPTADEFSCTSGRLGEHDDILRCGYCGMISSRPTLSPEELVELYVQTVDPTYLAELEGRRDMFGWVLDHLESYALRGRRLFEVASNMGVFLDVAGDRGWQARGVEPSRWAVDQGRQRFGVDLVQGTVETSGIGTDAADVFVMLDALEHVVDPVAALQVIRGAINDDGLLALTTINVESLHARFRRGAWPWFIRPHLHYFTPTTLRRTMAAAGFDMIEYRSVPRSFHLSYVSHRGLGNLGLFGRAAESLSRVWDPTLPVGLLGDVVLALGRPRLES
jgi:2-polyprenyl-3-methyl-5-hydroxy-6-metoxy-1,4-benzoquinol methylase